MKSPRSKEFNTLLRELANLHEAAGRTDLASSLRALTSVFDDNKNPTIDQAVETIRKARSSAAA